MAPEYGATIGFFPVDEESLNYLRSTGRKEEQIALVEAYYKAQGMFRTDDTPDPTFTEPLSLILARSYQVSLGQASAGSYRADGNEGIVQEHCRYSN